MRDLHGAHVFDRVEHLFEEEAASVFSEASRKLTNVEKQASLHKLKNYEDQTCQLAAWWLHYMAVVSVLKDLYDIRMFECLKNDYFVDDSTPGLLVFGQEFFSEDLDSHVVVGFLDGLG